MAARRRFPAGPCVATSLMTSPALALRRNAITRSWSWVSRPRFVTFHRAAIAALPRALRSSGDSAAAEALPPLEAPNLDSARAALDAAGLVIPLVY